MDLYVNVLLEWRNDTEENYVDRILWLDSKGEDAVTIDINDPKARPVHKKVAELNAALAACEARILTLDPYASLSRPEHEISPKHRAHRDKYWSLIEPLIENGDTRLFDFWSRELSINAYAKHIGHHKSTLYALLRKFWQRGRMKNALLPLFDNCGWRDRFEACQKKVEHEGQTVNHNRKLNGEQKGTKKLGRPTKIAMDGKSTGMNVDEDVLKKFRWGIKLYYETREAKTLREAHQRTIEKFFNSGYYITKNGTWVPSLPPASELPTYQQFKYWYKKERNPRRAKIAREGEIKFQLTSREITGDSTQMAFGPGSIYQIDATIGDVYLISSLDRNWIIGRPVIYFVKDVFSRMIVGLSVTLEGPSWIGAMLAIENATTDKVAYCAEYDIPIEAWEWPCCHLPEGLMADRGELEGYNADHLVNAFNIRIHNTPPNRGDLKGIIEQHIDLSNEKVIHWVPGAVRRRERGDRDYRLDAILDLHEFRKLMILSVLDYNRECFLEGYRKDEYMIADHVKPYPIDLWNWGIKNRSGYLRKKEKEIIRLNLLPEVGASVTGRGIYCDGLYYTCALARAEQWFIRAREKKSWKIRVARDPRNVERIYLRLDAGKKMEVCHLVEADKTFRGRDWYEAADEFELRRRSKAASRTRKMQSDAEFNATKDQIVEDAKKKTEQANGNQSDRARVLGIRKNRKAEREAERKVNAWNLGGDLPAKGESAQDTNKSQSKNNSYVPPAQPMDKLRELRERRLKK